MSAGESFDEGVREVRTLLNLIENRAGAGTAELNAINRASVVLLVSHFESFLKSIAEEFLDEIGNGDIEARRLPIGIRKLNSLPLLRQIIETNDEQQQRNLLKKIADVAPLWTDSAKPSARTLNAKTLSREVTSARPDVINRLFESMGHGAGSSVCDGEIDVATGPSGDMIPVNIRLSLDDVVKCRNDIAHGDSDRRPTPEDVDRYIVFLTTLKGRLEQKARILAQSVVLM